MISEQDRNDLHNGLAEVLGAQRAAVLMEHLPPVGWADVARRSDVEAVAVATRSDIDSLRTATRADFAAVRADVDALRASTKADLAVFTAELRAEMAQLGGELRKEMSAQTRTFVLSNVTLFVALRGYVQRVFK